MRIAGVNISEKKHIIIGLTAIYGVGHSRAKKICELAGVDPTAKGSDLTEDLIEKIRLAINDSNYSVEGDLRREVLGSIKSLMATKSYRGLRHLRGLPCRGQRTKTNAKTVRRRRSSKMIRDDRKK